MAASMFAGTYTPVYSGSGQFESHKYRTSSEVSNEYNEEKTFVLNTSGAWKNLNFVTYTECSGGSGGNDRFAHVFIGFTAKDHDINYNRTVLDNLNGPDDNVPINNYMTLNFQTLENTTCWIPNAELIVKTRVNFPVGEYGLLSAEVVYSYESWGHDVYYTLQ